jgi:hypothetical protein
LDKIWLEALLRKVAMGERRCGDAQITCHRWRATKMPRSERPKQGKKPTRRKRREGNEKKEREGHRDYALSK